MSTSFADVSDVEVLYRPLSDTEVAQATRLLRMASNMIRIKVANLDARIAAFTVPVPAVIPLDPDIATDVTATVVARAMRNPGGVTAQAVGPASVTYDDRVSAGFLYLTPDELAMLTLRPRPSIGTVWTREGLSHRLEQRADPELRFGDFAFLDDLEGDSPEGCDDVIGEFGILDPPADL